MAIGFRQILIVILVAAAVWFYKRRARRNHRVAAGKKRGSSRVYQDTVRCRQCGVYLPRGEARGDAEHGYLCPDPACQAQRHSHTGSAG